jgi:hypothetical protein
MENVRSNYFIHFNPNFNLYVIVPLDFMDEYLSSNFNIDLSNSFYMAFSSLKDLNRWFNKLEKECMV